MDVDIEGNVDVDIILIDGSMVVGVRGWGRRRKRIKSVIYNFRYFSENKVK